MWNWDYFIKHVITISTWKIVLMVVTAFLVGAVLL